MKAVIESFNKEIKTIRNHISFTEKLKENLSEEDDLSKYVWSREKKKFDYKSIIISTYGAFEFHLEFMVKNYLESLMNEIEDYSLINDNIKDNHFTFSLNLAAILDQNRILKYDHLNKIDVISQLNDCLSNKPAYKMNIEAFTIKSGNMKHVKVAELFKGIGISIINPLKESKSFKAMANSENLFNKIDYLVDLRNDIAHGNDSDILSNSEILPILDFMEKYFTALFEIIQLDLSHQILSYKKKHKSIVIEDYTICSSTVVGFTNTENINLEIESEIIIEQNNHNLVLAKVVSFSAHPDDVLTFKLSRRIKEGYNLYYITK